MIFHVNCNCPYQHVSLFNEFDDKFGKLDKDCWIGMFNVECIVKLSILKAILPIDAISKALVFVKLEYMSLLYNHNNSWIMSFTNSCTLVKNKHISVLGYNFFLCITSSNINISSSFNRLSKLQYLNVSIIMEYDDFFKVSYSKIVIFGLNHYVIEWQNHILNHSVQYWLCLSQEL